MSSALSDTTAAGTAITGPPAGFSVSTSNMSPGKTINLTYPPFGSNTAQQIQIVNVTDPTALPLQNAANANPKQIGLDLSQGVTPTVLAQLNAALNSSGISFSGSGSSLSITGSNAANITAASSTTTSSALTGNGVALPLFTDGNCLYTGAISGT